MTISQQVQDKIHDAKQESINAKDKMQEKKEKVTDAMQEGKDTVTDKAKQAGHSLAEQANGLKEKANEKIQDGIEYVNNQYGDVSQAIANYCKENPLKAIGMAFVAGCALSKILRK